MRISKFMVGMLVLGLAVSVLGAVALATPGHGNGYHASDTAIDNVSWTIQGFIELTIDYGAFDFGEIAAGIDSVSEGNANTLHVFSNTAWELTYLITGAGSDHLSVAMSSDEGEGSADVTVGYSLNNLRTMDPGTYTATVVYTVAAK